MKMKIQAYIEKHLPHEDFPRLFEEFLYGGLHQSDRKKSDRRVTDAQTLDIECRGQVLLASNKIGVAAEVKPFVKDVLAWSGQTGHIVLTKLRKQPWQETANAIEKSSRFLQAGDIRSAIETACNAGGMEIATASKILRMLSPQQAAVYSSNLSKALVYPATGVKRFGGYADFCSDCRKMADALYEQDIENPFRTRGKWYAADVEAVVFHDVDKKTPKKKKK